MKLSLNKKILIITGFVLIVLISKLLTTNMMSNEKDHTSRGLQTKYYFNHLASGMRFYKLDYGEYPEGSTSEILLQILGENPLNKKYLEGNPFTFDNEGNVLDEWGNPIKIEFESEGRLKILSNGPDGVEGNKDDILVK